MNGHVIDNKRKFVGDAGQLLLACALSTDRLSTFFYTKLNTKDVQKLSRFCDQSCDRENLKYLSILFGLQFPYDRKFITKCCK